MQHQRSKGWLCLADERYGGWLWETDEGAGLIKGRGKRKVKAGDATNYRRVKKADWTWERKHGCCWQEKRKWTFGNARLAQKGNEAKDRINC